MDSLLLKYLMNFYRKVDRIEESFDLINSKPKPLAAYLFSNNKKLKDELVIKISVGGICTNDIAIHLVIPSLPFGGVGESGMGTYHGNFSFDAFIHKKAVLYRGFMGDAAVRYPLYTPRKFRVLKALVSCSIWAIIKALFGLSEKNYDKPKTS